MYLNTLAYLSLFISSNTSNYSSFPSLAASSISERIDSTKRGIIS